MSMIPFKIKEDIFYFDCIPEEGWIGRNVEVAPKATKKIRPVVLNSSWNDIDSSWNYRMYLFMVFL